MASNPSSKPQVITINGRPVLLADGPDRARTQATLLDFLRDRGLTGAKEGCAEGECGACTVAMVDARPCRQEAQREGRHADHSGCAYRAVNSCLMFAPMAVDREIYTVEGLARGGHNASRLAEGRLADAQLAEAQTAMASAGGSQCGYCTPGFVMSLFAEQYRPGREGPCDPHALGGNLCRCTGYRPIRDAVLSLGPAPAGPFRDRLSAPADPLHAFAYEAGGMRFERPVQLAECLDILRRDSQAKCVAGATDMGVESNLRHRRWPHLVSLEAIPELREFHESAMSVRIGAGLPLTDVGLLWKSAPESARQLLPLFASPTIRNRATLGGNLATASPIGDSAPLLLSLDASLELVSDAGSRTIALSAFFTGYRRTELASGELIAAVEIPKPYPVFTRFYKASKRRMDDISTVAAGLSMDWDAQGRVIRVRFAFGGVAAIPRRAVEAEEEALGKVWNEATVARVQSALGRTLHPLTDHRGSAEYRVEVAKRLIEKFWWESRAAIHGEPAR